MPRYDYRCTVCGHEVELLRGIHDPGPSVCPNCGAVGSMRKAFATPAVHYKGSGWAKKDRSSSSRPAASSRSGESSKDGSSSKDRSSSSHEQGGEGATVTSTSEASPTGDGPTGDRKQAETARSSMPKQTSDRGAA